MSTERRLDRSGLPVRIVHAIRRPPCVTYELVACSPSFMIKDLHLDEAITAKLGLRPTSLERLGQIVLLAGRNGSGKSRFLMCLSDAVAIHSNNVAHAGQLRRRLKRETWTAEQAHTLEQQARENDEAAERIANITAPVPVVELYKADPLRKSTDYRSKNLKELDQAAGHVNTHDFMQLHEGMHIYLYQTARALLNAETPRLRDVPDIAARASEARAFEGLLADLGIPFSFDVVGNDPVPMLLGRRMMSLGELSAGQRLLVTWAIRLRQQGFASLRDKVLLIDELENHLHPAAGMDILQRIRSQLGEHGQLWIATHSPAIIAGFPDASLYSVKDGTASFAGTRVTEVMDGLLGGQEARTQFRDFLDRADSLAFYKFAVESLLPPTVAEARPGDPQTTQLCEILKSASSDEPKRIRLPRARPQPKGYA